MNRNIEMIILGALTFLLLNILIGLMETILFPYKLNLIVRLILAFISGIVSKLLIEIYKGNLKISFFSD